MKLPFCIYMIFKYRVLGECLGAVVDPKRNFRCRGLSRKTKKRIFQIESHSHSLSLRSSVLQNLKHMFTDPELEVLLIDRDIPLQAFSLLVDVAADPGLDLNLVLVYNSFMNGELHNGYAFSNLFNGTVGIPSLLAFHYLHDVPLFLHDGTAAPLPVNRNLIVFDPPAKGGILRSMHELSGIYIDNFLTTFSRLDSSYDEILGIIMSYVSTHFDFSCFSTAKQDLLYMSAFIVVQAPRLSDTESRTLWRSVQFSGRRRYRSRRHRLFASTDQFAYWWDRLSERPPFISHVFPPPLLRWRNTIEDFMPQILRAPECLLAAYERGSDQLPLHSDCELREFLEDFELVVLTFLGGCRDLVIRSNSRRSSFKRVITCSPSLMVIMTPFGNRHFLHGKTPARDSQDARAATLAFRTAIGFDDALRIYPDFSQYVVPIGPEGVPPITPGN